MELIILLWIGCGVGAGLIAQSKGRNGVGWGLLGFLFGPFGLLAAAIISPDEGVRTNREQRAGLQSGTLRRCPECAEPIQREALKCRFCAAAVEPVAKRGLF